MKKREGERIVEKFFKLNEKGSNVKTELIAGLTTFLAMAYILGVNPAVLADAGMDKASVFLATAISAGVASIIMGLVANYPVALASGMGVNALFAYTICGQMGFSWAAALSAVFISGVIFIIISVTGVRKAIINAIPVQLKLAIGAGIGFFIAFVGLKNAGIIRNRLKINAMINNAKVFKKIQNEYNSFSNYIWGFTNNKTIPSN